MALNRTKEEKLELKRRMAAKAGYVKKVPSQTLPTEIDKMSDVMLTLGWENALLAFEKAFPHIDLIVDAPSPESDAKMLAFSRGLKELIENCK